MASIHLLTVEAVQEAPDGDHADGGGLSLRVEGSNAKWVYRYTAPSGKRRAMALGTAVRSGTRRGMQASMESARELAQEARSLLRRGLDPIALRNATRIEARQKEASKQAERRRERLTLARVARDYHERVIQPNRTAKHGAQWIASLENHVPEKFWNAPIDSIEAPPLLDFYIELFGRVPETASRIIQRLRAIFGHAEFNKLRAGNPAHAAAVKLHELKLKRRRRKFAALPFAEVPAFMRELRKREGIAARALEFAVLTAARTGEVIGATWGEFDLEAGLWVIPASRMKGGEAHTVYLSPRAVEIVKAAKEYGGESHVFPNPTDKTAPLSNMAMLTLLRRMNANKRTTVHGLCRASFSTWANDTNAARSDVIEACLAHREGNKVRAAYNRAKFAAERKALLSAWADYCDGRKLAASNETNVIPLPIAA
jgi:integrase